MMRLNSQGLSMKKTKKIPKHLSNILKIKNTTVRKSFINASRRDIVLLLKSRLSIDDRKLLRAIYMDTLSEYGGLMEYLECTWIEPVNNYYKILQDNYNLSKGRVND